MITKEELELKMRKMKNTNCLFCNKKWTEEHHVKIGLKYICDICLIRLGDMIKFVY